MIGTSVPIIVALAVWLYANHREFRKNLYFVERIVVYTINDLIDTKKTITHFLKKRIKRVN